jgi:hypothetical protein
MIRFLMSLCVCLALLACDESSQMTLDEAAPIRVSAYRGNCVCLRIQEGNEIGSGAWKEFGSSIDGFAYEEGFTYLIVVRTERILDPVTEMPVIKYTLIKVLSKDKV